ncbi:hypothetical protein AAVH_31873, partial [Aphelenchoides avenae]
MNAPKFLHLQASTSNESTEAVPSSNRSMLSAGRQQDRKLSKMHPPSSMNSGKRWPMSGARHRATTLIILLWVLPCVTDAAAYFYGATDIAENQQKPPTDLPLKMEAKELRTVYNYCRSLPLLMEQGI